MFGAPPPFQNESAAAQCRVPAANRSHDGKSPAIFRRSSFAIPRITLVAPGTRCCSSHACSGVRVDVTAKGPPGKNTILHKHYLLGAYIPRDPQDHHFSLSARLCSLVLSFYLSFSGMSLNVHLVGIEGLQFVHYSLQSTIRFGCSLRIHKPHKSDLSGDG